jgi:membrane protein YdbS with pleckstrin-like domain
MSWPAAPERVDAAPPPRGDEPPSRRLAAGAKWAWRLHLIGIWIALGVLSAVLGNVTGIAAAILFTGSTVLLAPVIVLVPELRYRRWRWDVRPDVIDIQHGTFTVRRTLVPLERVQHVDTRRGVIEQMLDLATVVVHTAAGSHTIPYLAVDDASELRDRIASLARSADG